MEQDCLGRKGPQRTVALEKEEEEEEEKNKTKKKKKRPLLLKYGNFLPTTMARQGLLQCCCVLQSIDELINY
jgi:hypothetical protein